MRIPVCLTAAMMAVTIPMQGAESQNVLPATTYQYADLADLALTAPIVVSAEISSASQLKRDRAVGVPAGFARFYIEATVLSLIRGANGVPGQLHYLVDMPLDSRGRAPKVRKRDRVLLLASPVSGRPGEIQLVARDAQLPWAQDTENRLRSILTEATRTGAPPQITGIGNAFHVPGTLPGEGETQIFLTTPDHRPVSLTILRRPGEERRWAVALSEIVDEAAEPPAKDTLLWYRLACSLPATLPERSLNEADYAQGEAIRGDYQFVKSSLGECKRSRKADSPQPG